MLTPACRPICCSVSGGMAFSIFCMVFSVAGSVSLLTMSPDSSDAGSKACAPAPPFAAPPGVGGPPAPPGPAPPPIKLIMRAMSSALMLSIIPATASIVEASSWQCGKRGVREEGLESGGREVRRRAWGLRHAARRSSW